MYNYDARLYDPALRMFITPDSILPDAYDPQQLNRLAYARNNPLKYIDPSGHQNQEVEQAKKDDESIHHLERQKKQVVKAGNAVAEAAYKTGTIAIDAGGIGTITAIKETIDEPTVENAVNAAAAATLYTKLKTAKQVISTVIEDASKSIVSSTPITKKSVIEGFNVSNHAFRKSGLGRGATEEMVSSVIQGAKKAGTVVTEQGTGKFAGNVIEVYSHNGVKVAVDTTQKKIMSIRPIDNKNFKLPGL